MPPTPKLARLVRQSRWSDLEDAWTELILEDPSPGPALAAVQAAAERKELPRCIALVREQAEMLASSGSPAEAAQLLGETMLLGGSPGELGKPLFAAAEAAWGGEAFWEAYIEIADLRENAPDMRASWKEFQKLLAMTPGRVVYHATGWGLARVEALDPAGRQVDVRFASGRRDRLPFRSAIEIFDFLDEDDLRALVMNDPEELERRLKEEPLDVLRWVLARNKGRANQAAIKLSLGTLGVEGARFTTWWRRAKKAAENDEWFELSGPANRVTVRMLDTASDPVEGIRRQLGRAKSLTEALQRVKALVAGGAAQQEVESVAFETLRELASHPGRDESARLATWIFLREHTGETPEPLVDTLRAAVERTDPTDPSVSPELWRLFQQVPGLREQERCIELLREVLGEPWLDEAESNLAHAAPGMVRGLVEALHQAGRGEALAQHYKSLLARPTRNPMLLVRLAEHMERRGDRSDLPPALNRVQCLLQLTVHLYKTASGDPIMTRARMRMTEVLSSGDPPLLQELLQGADTEGLRGLAKMIEGNVEPAVDRLFTHVAVAQSPDVFRGDERPFWEMSGTWTTRAGLRKREEELRVLTEEKIPQNSEAIGRAASFGDLSENSEWEAAIEEQRTLTQRAMELENLIRGAQLLENAAIPEDTVAPGTRVRYREEDGSEHAIEVVGPWDVEREGQVSYRSPLASGMLGCHAGERATLELPAGTKRVEIVHVDVLDRG